MFLTLFQLSKGDFIIFVSCLQQLQILSSALFKNSELREESIRMTRYANRYKSVYEMPHFLCSGVSSCGGLGSGKGGEYRVGAPRRYESLLFYIYSSYSDEGIKRYLVY